MPVLLPLARLTRVCNPFLDNPWLQPVTKKAVATALIAGELEPRSYQTIRQHSDTLQFHIARIAYLVVNGWQEAIDLDIGCELMPVSYWRLPEHPVVDGNHRLAAAIFRKDRFISATVSGDVDLAFKLFRVCVIEGDHECNVPSCKKGARLNPHETRGGGADQETCAT